MPQPDFCPITARGVFPRLTADMSLTIEPDDPKAAMLTPPWLTVSTRIELFWDRDYSTGKVAAAKTQDPHAVMPPLPAT